MLGLKLSELRRQQHLTLQEVANRSGLAVSYLNEIEKGRKYPKPSKILDLASALGTTYEKLVSPDLGENYRSLSSMLGSDLLQRLPLEALGISPANLMALLGSAPAGINAAVELCDKISQRFNIDAEHLIRAAVLSYVEQKKYYFPEIESQVVEFRQSAGLSAEKALKLSTLSAVLLKRWKCKVDETALSEDPVLAKLKAVTPDSDPPRLLLNPALSPAEKVFHAAREVGYRHLDMHPRVRTSPPLTIESYNQLVHDYRASYFAGALLLDREKLSDDLRSFLGNRTWDGDALLRIMNKHGAEPELFFHRITQLALQEIGVEPLFFVRMDQENAAAEPRIAKEIHPRPMEGVYTVAPTEHYCRRWLSVRLLNQLQQQAGRGQVIVGAGRSRMTGLAHELLMMGIAYNRDLKWEGNSCVILGFAVSEAAKRVFRFLGDPQIPFTEEGQTCERCGFNDCMQRVAPGILYEKQVERDRLLNRIRSLDAPQAVR